VKEILSHKHSDCSLQYYQQNQLKVNSAHAVKICSKSTELNSVKKILSGNAEWSLAWEGCT